MQISAHLEGGEKLQQALGRYASQIPEATRLAINWTAASARLASQRAIRANLDNPTPATTQGLFIEYATKQTLVAEVRVKDRDGEKFNGRSMAETIGQQFSGGPGRARTRLEQAFTRARHITAGEYLAPGPDALLDRFGNLAKSQIAQIYAALKSAAGLAPRTKTGKLRNTKTTRAAARIFWSSGRTKARGLRRGLWATDDAGGLRLLLVAIPRVSYKKRIDLLKITRDTVAATFAANFRRGLDKAISTAK